MKLTAIGENVDFHHPIMHIDRTILLHFSAHRKGAMLGFSTMGITFIMGGYLMLGAVIFSGLEGGDIITSYHPL